jgi:DNA-binding transcriptional ArsR family regulator
LEDADAVRKPPSERTRPIDEAVLFAVGHRIRVDALAILAEGTHSVNEIAEMLDEDVRLVGNHIRKLFDAGCIEAAGTAQVRNVTEHFYRAVTMPYISDEAYRAMSPKARREIIGLIIQSIMAESMASFQCRKLEKDEDAWLLWDSLDLDAEGRRELAAELEARYSRFLKIKKKSEARMAKSGEKGVPTVVALMGFERSRRGRPEKGFLPTDLPEVK